MTHRLPARIAIFLWLVFLVVPTLTQAQEKDNLGREFYVAFGPNRGGEDPNDGETANEIELYISSKVATTGRVEVPALNFDRTFTTTPGQITTIPLPDGNNFGPTVIVSNVETIVKGMAVHITAEAEIAVFGMNHKMFSTDAFMALPIDVLGTEYRVMSYQTSTVGSGGMFIPGQFMVVGVEDNTNVTITPRGNTTGKLAGLPVNLVMNRGDVYLMQTALQEDIDLTGSLVESDRAIAVFGGHERTEIPAKTRLFNGRAPSRDHLVEQLPPVSSWGDSAFVIPNATVQKPDLVRILSSEDNNTITVNGVQVATLNAGDFYEIKELTGVAQVKATNPIMIGQYLHTSWGELDNQSNPAYGDPGLALVFPVEQYTNDYTIVSVENADAFTGNFVNIVVEASGVPSMRIDGNPIDPSEFKPITGTTYVYAQLSVSQGTHNLHGDKPFGVTVYGLGNVDSYSYTGGTLTKTITPLKTEGLIIDFGDRPIQPVAPYAGFFDTTVSVKNVSTEDVTVYDFPRRTQDVTKFSVIAPTTPLTIPPGGSVDMTIRFEPLEPNRRMHTQITAKTDHLRAYVVDVYGRGVIEQPLSTADSALRIPIQEIDFGYFARTDPPYDSAGYIGNLGLADLSVVEMTITGPNATDFTVMNVIGTEGPVTVPFTVPKSPGPGTRVELRFTPSGADGPREALLTYKTKAGLEGKIRLLANILTLEMPTVLGSSFEETPLCKPGRKTIKITNPNSIAMRIDSIVFRGANPFDFMIDHPIPFEIPPRSEMEVPLVFSPEDIGDRSAQAYIYFNMPKGLWRMTALAGSGSKFPLEYHIPKHIHILTGEEFELPIYADVDLTPFKARGFTVHLRYDPTHLEDMDVRLENTYAEFADLQFDGDWGERIIHVTLWDNALLTGGGKADPRPLIVVKFKSFLAEGENRMEFQEDVPIHYNLQLKDKEIEDYCIAQRVRTGIVSLDSTCAEIHLVSPWEVNSANMQQSWPNPVSTSAIIPYDVPGDLPVRIELLNELGYVVKVLVDQPTGPGTHDAKLDVGDLSSGVYMARMTYGGKVKQRRIVVAK